HAAFDLVRAVVLEERVDHPSHRRDLARGMRHHVRLAPAEPTHVGEERALLAPAQIAPAHTVPPGALQDRLVDIRNVLRVADGLPTGLEMTHEDVEREERARVAEMR